MEAEETSENFPSKKLKMNTVDDVDDHALAPALGGGVAGRLTALDNSVLEGVSESAKEHNLEKSENSVGNGGLLPVNHHCPPTAGPGVGEDLLPLPVNGADVRGGEKKGEGYSDLEEGKAGDGKSDDDDDDDDEVEYGDEDMFFDPVPPERLHKNDSIKEPMGEGGRNWGEGEQN